MKKSKSKSKSIFGNFVNDDINHVHHLYGFIIDGAEYLIRTESKKAAGANGKVLINMNFGATNNKSIKNIIRLDLSMQQKYSKSLDHFVTFTPVPAPTSPNKTKIATTATRAGRVAQIGGEFPLGALPYSCDAVHLTQAPEVVPMYSEPAINYIESLGAATYATMTLLHTTIGEPYFDPHVALVTPTNYADRSYRNVLLTEHLRHNKFAHNGIESEEDITALTDMFGDVSYKTLQLIHSLCHMYDALYVYSSGSAEFEANRSMLAEYDRLVTNAHQRHCLMRKVNIKRDAFLVHDGDKISIPYSVKPDAKAHKARQYSRHCYSGQLVPSLQRNICLDADNVQTGTTYDMPNE